MCVCVCVSICIPVLALIIHVPIESEISTPNPLHAYLRDQFTHASNSFRPRFTPFSICTVDHNIMEISNHI